MYINIIYNIYINTYIYIYIYISYICKLCMSMFNVNIYIKNRHLLLNELYFGFFQTFEDSIK